MYQNLFDSHTHSENSKDGNHSVIFMVESAIENGLAGLCVTDHCESDLLAENCCLQRLCLTAMDIAKARVAFRNSIILTTGIELGEPQLDYAGAERALSILRYDFVLLAVHRLRGWEDFYYLDFSAMSPQTLDGLLRQYFDETLETVRWGNFDSLAHFCLPQRYAKCKYGMDLDFTPYADQIDEILRALVASGKALELNTSGLRCGMSDMLAPQWVVKRYRELGGELVTLGSDAHYAADIGAGIQDAMHLLLELGFSYFAFYRGRKPVMLRII